MTALQTQYEFVKDSREILFGLCAEIAPEDFTSTNSIFGRGSVRNLLAHIANTYEFWIAKHTLQCDN